MPNEPREKFCSALLKEAADNLRSSSPNDIYLALIKTAFVVESVIKQELAEINPFLQYDLGRGLKPEHRLKILLGKVTSKLPPRGVLFKDAITLFVRIKQEHSNLELQLQQLAQYRNELLHSIGKISFTADQAGDITSQVLLGLKDIIQQRLRVVGFTIEPKTYSQIEGEKEKFHKRTLKYLEMILRRYRDKYNKLTKQDIEERRSEGGIEAADGTIWIEEKDIDCPACGESTLDKMSGVDFDWNPDGILSGGWTLYRCRVCEVELKEYEFDLLTELPSDSLSAPWQ